MSSCKFCPRTFQSEQGVKAHLKHCDQYKIQKTKQTRALGSEPKAAAPPAATPPFQSSPQVAQPDPTAPWREWLQSMAELSTKPAEPPSPQQRRRNILQTAKKQVIDLDRNSRGPVTAAMRGSAKMSIEQELATLPLEDLPFDEVCELATAIRERVYAPTFTRHAQEAEHQNAELEARRSKQIEELAAELRVNRRKSILIEQAIGQARARCEAQQVVGLDRLSVLGDIELRLTEWLTGRESLSEAHAIIQSVLDARFVEVEAKQKAARAKKDAKWRAEMIRFLVLGALVGLIVLAVKFPAYTSAILNWIRHVFGPTPGAETGSPNQNASGTTSSSASAEPRPPSRRQRKDPVAPVGPAPCREDSVGVAPGHA